MKDNDLITRREVERILLEKGQRSRRYSLGEVWELNFDEIREALSEYRPKIVWRKDCKHGELCNEDVFCTNDIGTIESSVHKPDWFCAYGERR